MSIMRGHALATIFRLCLILPGLAACAGMTVPKAVTDEAAYTSLYPYYAEFCALSGLGKKPGFGAELTSGPGGHAVLYLNNVCRDGVGSGKLKLCDHDVPPDQRGVGLSVNDHFANVAWVATPGMDFFFNGNLLPIDPLTYAAYDKIKQMAEAQDIYTGVDFHEHYFDDLPAGRTPEELKYELSVGTDYAVSVGRARLCARAPLDQSRMQEIINYLNDINAPFHAGLEPFHWSLFQNNCTHIAHNALAATDLWAPLSTGRILLTSIFDFPVPKNEFVNLVRQANDLDIADLEGLYRDATTRRDLLEEDNLPTSPGGLAEAAGIVAPNQVYDTKARLIFYDDPITGSYQRAYNRIFSNDRYTDLRSNLLYFAGLYDRIIAERQPVEAHLRHFADADVASFSLFYDRYYAYIDQQRQFVAAALERID